MLWGKAKKIEALVLRHLEQVDITLDAFHKAIIAYVVDGDVKRAKALALETHKAEGEADDIRREVEAELLGGLKFIPVLIGLFAMPLVIDYYSKKYVFIFK